MYEFTLLKEDFSIKRIVTVHYFEYSDNYEFTGESHGFYEFVYIDKGEADIYDGERVIRLSHGEGFFHMPGVWHNIKATGSVAPNIIVVSFDCRSPKMEFVRGKIFKLTSVEKSLLASVIKEAETAFKTPLNDPYTKKLVRGKHTVGAEQIIKISLEMLIISLCRGKTEESVSVIKKHIEEDTVEAIKKYLNENVHEKLKFPQIVSYMKMSGTAIKTAFKKSENMGVMAYFAELKIERAKQYMREDNYNFTQISQLLSYESPHRFTKQFKAKTGMTPTEYVNSVKVQIKL